MILPYPAIPTPSKALSFAGVLNGIMVAVHEEEENDEEYDGEENGDPENGLLCRSIEHAVQFLVREGVDPFLVELQWFVTENENRAIFEFVHLEEVTEPEEITGTAEEVSFEAE